MDIANRIATSRGGVLVSGIVLTLSFGLAPLVVGGGEAGEAPSAGSASTASVATAHPGE